ncbi:LysM peptidoglycan-binding domain-containing protein [Micromonospora sp. R77]|uniref:BTAD domain-containing putative transcriptional regulator n=1 Tax=Micromonospora sp. R77 TaxID=2925836 RepID=UPI001F610D95|nr:BTAD domain-containing putative transcriptional regulator [Micromonospora sp. R77]MCI4066163.1 LysM peptidoglycan-binding domain-containing protein [Micromonospora sp. R77]
MLLWLFLTTAVLAHTYRRIAYHCRWLPALRLPGPVKGLTAALLGATTVTTTAAGAAPSHAAPAPDAVHDLEQPAASSLTVAPPAQHATQRQDLTVVVAGGQTYTHTVKRGETLSEIAAQWLGDADRWPEIFALNRGTHFAHAGGTLRSPNVIYPGWTLDLPGDAIPPTAHQPRPRPVPDRPSVPTPAPAPTRDPAPPATPAPTATEPGPTRTPTAGTCAPTDGDTASRGDVHGPTDDPTSRSADASRGVSLSTGSWLNLALALSIAAAVALVWAHRQRRYTPHLANAPTLDTPPLAPIPRVIQQIRRALRHAVPEHADVDPLASTAAPVTGLDDTTTVSGTHHAAGNHVTRAETASVPNPAPHAAIYHGSGNPTPALLPPLSAAWPPAGLGLTGPAAHAAARGFLTTALAADTDTHAADRTQVVIPAPTAAALLGSAVTLPHTPRLMITAGLAEALDILDALTLHRTRLINDHETTIADLRADGYDEPLPPVVLLADPTHPAERARIAALLAQGQHLDIHGVLLGTWLDGTTITVHEDGTTTPADSDTPHDGTTPVGRLTVLNPTETLDLITTLAEAHTGEVPLPAPTEPAPLHARPTTPTHPAHLTPPAPTTQSTPSVHMPPPVDPSRTDHADNSPAHTTAAGSTAATTPETPPPPDEPDTGTTSQVRITVLGPPAITDANPQRTLRAKSLELLVYLACRDGTASTEAILDDLLPDAPARKAVHRLHTYVSDLRSALRHHAGPGTYLTHPRHHYQLNPDRLDVDLWRMRAAIRAANTATTTPARIAALRRAVDTYRAPLAEGCAYEWLEPYREAVRREALHAAVALTEELEGQPAEQLAVIDQAITHHPYTEQLYQAAMRARAELGDADGIRALRRTVTHHLAEIDTQPSAETLTLADTLLADLSRSSGSPRSSAVNRARS